MSDDGASVDAHSEENLTPIQLTISQVIKDALFKDGVVRGLREVVKSIEQKTALVVFLAENCEEAGYTKLIKALCDEKGIPLVEVPDSKQLGKWAGLGVVDKENVIRQIVGASSVSITVYGEESEHLEEFQKHITALTAS